ncbi:MAG: hypothetical protein JSV31_29415 [Desulfobacterales bacterium]|nr:MAG: hypothetical protein JSV31_29415 [Desulfobacterales bacterium]
MQLDPDNEYSPTKLMLFKFLHVYGKISDLPWQSPNHLNYGPVGEIKIDDYSQNIRIIYDKRIDEEEIKIIRDEIHSAKRIYFLGFGFALENLKILDFPNVLMPGQKVYGTAYNAKEEEIEEIKNRFVQNNEFNKALHDRESELIIKNTNCLDLLRERLH